MFDLGAAPIRLQTPTSWLQESFASKANSRKSLVLVIDTKFGKALGLGESLMNTETARQTKKDQSFNV